jgi:hypothetical protein
MTGSVEHQHRRTRAKRLERGAMPCDAGADDDDIEVIAHRATLPLLHDSSYPREAGLASDRRFGTS